MTVFFQRKRTGKYEFSGGTWAASLLSGLLTVLPMSSQALTLSECTRTTHVSHGGEADHRDLGEGRVMWRDWWSQEGIATDFSIVDCARGEALMFRTAEERMTDRGPFDRTAKALQVIETHESGARVFSTFERMQADLKAIARDIEIKSIDTEPCACAALYPGARGDKTAFELGEPNAD